MDNEKFSGRNQSIGCALVWVTIARDSESAYTFKSCGAIPQDLCRSLILSLPIRGEIKWQLFLDQSTVFTERCDWKNVGHPADLFKCILIDSNLPVTCWHPWSFIVVLTAPKTSNFDLIWFNLIKYLPTKFLQNGSTDQPFRITFSKKEGGLCK